MADMDFQATEQVIRVVRQLGHVAQERAELATYLGFEAEATVERDLGRRYRQLSGQARHVFEACDLDGAEKASPAAGPEPVPVRTWVPQLPTVLDLHQRLSPGQRRGNHCYICDGVISVDEPDQRSAVLNNVQLFTHIDPAVCTRVLDARLNEECPF